jgi:hypothetical protein
MKCQIALVTLFGMSTMLMLLGCFNNSPSAHLSAVAAIHSRPRDADGYIELAPEHNSLSIDGRVLVMQLSNEVKAYLFLKVRGKGSNMKGVLVTDGPIDELIEKDVYGNDSVLLSLPDIAEGGPRVVNGRIAVIHRTGDELVFEVSRSLD